MLFECYVSVKNIDIWTSRCLCSSIHSRKSITIYWMGIWANQAYSPKGDV